MISPLSLNRDLLGDQLIDEIGFFRLDGIDVSTIFNDKMVLVEGKVLITFESWDFLIGGIATDSGIPWSEAFLGHHIVGKEHSSVWSWTLGGKLSI